MFDFGNNFSINWGIEKIHLPIEFIWVPAGEFFMGSPFNENNRDDFDDELPFKVTISKGFWLSKFLLTNEQWSVISQLPVDFKNIYPKNNISYDESLLICDELNKEYFRRLPQQYRFSLPTEAQWEYACRAGTTSIFYNGSDLQDFLKIGWCKENSKGKIRKVGLLEPNDWGFYDILGNLSEWCIDYPIAYPSDSQVDWCMDPIILKDMDERNDFPLKNYRVHRSGSFLNFLGSRLNKISFRGWSEKNIKSEIIGLRLCLRYFENND